MRPQPHRARRRGAEREDLVEQGGPDPLLAGAGMHGDLDLRTRCRVGGVDVGEPEQGSARRVRVLGEDAQPGAAGLQLQQRLLTHRRHTVGVRGVSDQGQDGGDLVRGEVLGGEEARELPAHDTASCVASRSVATVLTSNPSSWRGGTKR